MRGDRFHVLPVPTEADVLGSAATEYAESQGWGDGLPVVAPTPERVELMIASVSMQPDEIVAVLPPSEGAATVELIAANAVLAGCMPEHFPLVLKAIEALANPRFSLLGVNTTTNPVVPLLIVNGPIREQLGLNMSWGVLGSGGANAVISRAVDLCMRNIAGRIPGGACRATYKIPAGVMCAAEFEERSPWPPLHVDLGLQESESAVTVMAVAGLSDLVDVWADDGEELAQCLAHMMAAQVGTNWIRPGLGEIGVMLCPPHAELLAATFPDRRQLQEYLHAHCRTPVSAITPMRASLMKQRGVYETDKAGILVSHRPEQWLIFVAGGLGGYHSCHLHPFSASYAVTLPIQ